MNCTVMISLMGSLKRLNILLPVFQPNGILNGISVNKVRSIHNGLLSQNCYKTSSIARYCSNQPNRNGLPKLTDLPIVYWPSFFKYAKNAILSKYIIQQRYDQDFDLDKFILGSREVSLHK